jgi:hypothetical protein
MSNALGFEDIDIDFTVFGVINDNLGAPQLIFILL